MNIFYWRVWYCVEEFGYSDADEFISQGGEILELCLLHQNFKSRLRLLDLCVLE